MALVPAVPTDRLRGAFLAMVYAVAPQLLYLGTYEARVVAASPPSIVQSQLGGLTWVVSAVFSDPAIAKVLPPLANITIWPGPVWAFSAPAPGSLVRIAFVNGNPSKPAIVGLDPGVPATPATPVMLGSPVALPVAMAAPIVALNGAIDVWAAAVATWATAVQAALANPSNATPNQVATQLSPATTALGLATGATLAPAIVAASAATPATIVKGL